MFCCLQLLSSEEYQSSKRISVYLSMPMEVQTEGILQVHVIILKIRLPYQRVRRMVNLIHLHRLSQLEHMARDITMYIG